MFKHEPTGYETMFVENNPELPASLQAEINANKAARIEQFKKEQENSRKHQWRSLKTPRGWKRELSEDAHFGIVYYNLKDDYYIERPPILFGEIPKDWSWEFRILRDGKKYVVFKHITGFESILLENDPNLPDSLKQNLEYDDIENSST